MKIAQVSPLFEAVPPRYYGGTERVVAYLADELVARGHDVTLFASGDSKTSARLVNCREQALRLDGAPLKSELAAHLTMLAEVRRRADEFDLIHLHVELLPCPLFEDIAAKTITTTHSRLDFRDLQGFYRRWPHFPLVSISDQQRKPLDFANWVGTVQHGLPLDLYQGPATPSGSYVAFLGRLSPEKQPEVAMRVAERAGRQIRVAAKVDPSFPDYFCKVVEPLLQRPHVDFVGEIGEAEKGNFLGNAEALLVPVNWPEPFGMVLIEAMACGTPVIALGQGAIPEIIEDGVTGLIVETEDEMVAALERAGSLDRKRIRAEFKRRFSAAAMADNYLHLYARQLEAWEEISSPLPSALDTTTLEPSREAIPTSMEEPESRMPYQLFALKHKDTFAVADSFGNIIGVGDGLYRDDTRVLSEFRLALGDQPASLLSATISQDNVFFTAHVTNRPLPPLGGRSIPEGVIHLKRTRFLFEERLFEQLELLNFGDHEVTVPLKVRFGADFLDMFEVRGEKRAARGTVREPERRDDHVILSYEGLDGIVRSSVVAFSHQPLRLREDHAEFQVNLPNNRPVELYVEIGPAYEAQPDRRRYRLAAARARRSMRRRGRRGGVLHSSERVFNSWLEHSRSDLALLTTELETGPYPYAGIPWFSTPFGRDAVITAMQMLWFDPGIARGVLSYLARNQATEHSTFRDSAPGKIMHETRKGEMNVLKELPFGLYYGGVDTTPLFVALAGQYAERTGDLGFVEELWPALTAAMEWIEETGDTKGDGFLDYLSGEETGLRNQGWKDSEDSVFHADGRFPDGSIALVEVQGYKYAALRSMAAMSDKRGDAKAARHWDQRARTIQQAVEDTFWMDDKQFYALALDEERNLCRVRASNAGHLLFTGLASPERAQKVTHQLLCSAFDCGWGIRTLANDEVRFNPMSYHNGSVWPHDTAICAAGMARYGDREAAAHILSCLFDATVHFGMRLPELFCGFAREPGEPPVAYPVACLPQAWASGALFMTLQAALGIHIDGWRKEVHIVRPELPTGLNHLAVRRIPVGDARVDLTFQRVRDRVAVFSQPENRKGVRVLTHI
ncbi:glycogen debranching N-terminal domain-containing protein [Gilvimarinus sp. F26214L]|uniref:glycogen debranching N-terminal domain-containing protein n=1 Tax=Gilvimarinus sp. DZF01 TaxID=3461371 RepID=UPI0040452DA4